MRGAAIDLLSFAQDLMEFLPHAPHARRGPQAVGIDRFARFYSRASYEGAADLAGRRNAVNHYFTHAPHRGAAQQRVKESREEVIYSRASCEARRTVEYPDDDGLYFTHAPHARRGFPGKKRARSQNTILPHRLMRGAAKLYTLKTQIWNDFYSRASARGAALVIVP